MQGDESAIALALAEPLGGGLFVTNVVMAAVLIVCQKKGPVSDPDDVPAIVHISYVHPCWLPRHHMAHPTDSYTVSKAGCIIALH